MHLRVAYNVVFFFSRSLCKFDWINGALLVQSVWIKCISSKTWSREHSMYGIYALNKTKKKRIYCFGDKNGERNQKGATKSTYPHTYSGNIMVPLHVLARAKYTLIIQGRIDGKKKFDVYTQYLIPFRNAISLALFMQSLVFLYRPLPFFFLFSMLCIYNKHMQTFFFLSIFCGCFLSRFVQMQAHTIWKRANERKSKRGKRRETQREREFLSIHMCAKCKRSS